MSTGALFSVTCHRNCVEEMEKTGKSRKYSENSFWEQLKLPECTWIEKYVSCIKNHEIIMLWQGVSSNTFLRFPLSPLGAFTSHFQDLPIYWMQILTLLKRKAEEKNQSINQSNNQTKKNRNHWPLQIHIRNALVFNSPIINCLGFHLLWQR